MDCCSSLFACVWNLIGNALNDLKLPHWLLFALFHIFHLLLNLTEAPNMMGFPHPSCPICYFIITQFSQLFLPSAQSSWFGFCSSLHSHFPLSTCTFPGYKRKSNWKILRLLYGIWALLFLPVCKKCFTWRASAGMNCWSSVALQWSCNGVY